MTLRHTTTRAIGAGLALSLVGAASAAAQSSAASAAPSERNQASSTSGEVALGTTSTMTTTPVAAGAIAPSSPVAEPAAAQPPMGQRTGRFGNGVYFGLQGGANFPQGDINTFYDAGWNAGAQLGWDPRNSPLGLRLNLNYNRLNGRNVVTERRQTGPAVTETRTDLQNADLWSAFADAKLRLPFGRFLGTTSGLYTVGGVGLTQFRNYQNFTNVTGINTGGSVVNLDPQGNRNVTRFAINGGGGIGWGIGSSTLFVEGRYVRVFTQGRDTDYVPVTIGLSFH